MRMRWLAARFGVERIPDMRLAAGYFEQHPGGQRPALEHLLLTALSAVAVLSRARWLVTDLRDPAIKA